MIDPNEEYIKVLEDLLKELRETNVQQKEIIKRLKKIV